MAEYDVQAVGKLGVGGDGTFLCEPQSQKVREVLMVGGNIG